MILYSCLLMSTAVFLIATTSIGIQTYNANATYKNKYKKNFYFLVVMLVCAILCTLASFGGMYMGASGA
jgi:surface polysaccharide O-acyltransferase-like enzyme